MLRITILLLLVPIDDYILKYSTCCRRATPSKSWMCSFPLAINQYNILLPITNISLNIIGSKESTGDLHISSFYTAGLNLLKPLKMFNIFSGTSTHDWDKAWRVPSRRRQTRSRSVITYSLDLSHILWNVLLHAQTLFRIIWRVILSVLFNWTSMLSKVAEPYRFTSPRPSLVGIWCDISNHQR